MDLHAQFWKDRAMDSVVGSDIVDKGAFSLCGADSNCVELNSPSAVDIDAWTDPGLERQPQITQSTQGEFLTLSRAGFFFCSVEQGGGGHKVLPR